MLQNRSLEIYPNSRSIRERLRTLKSDQILPKYITIGEFEKKLLYVKDRVFIDDDTRVLLLKEASDFESFKSLDIDREFFSFLKNSKFLFSFFDELSMEDISLDELLEYDYYELFREHISILKLLKQRYISLLDERAYYDKMTTPLYAKINSEFIEEYDEITLYLEGYLNSYELQLIEEVSKIRAFRISLVSDRFNKKMIDKFKSFGFDLKEGMEYLIDFSKREIVDSSKINRPAPKIELFSANSRTIQVSFIKKAIYELVNKGVEAENIAVIVPDISMVDTIDLFDDENIFNFAMGRAYTNSLIYKKLNAIYLYLKDPSLENRHRLSRIGIGDDHIKDISSRYNKQFSAEQMRDEFRELVKEFEGDELKIYNEELHLFSKLFSTLSVYKFIEVLHLFLNRLKNRRVDDVGGGKVTVIELLESRGYSFEGVIIVDFNEGKVPYKTQKDIFLSSDLRSLVGLPTIYDRENLQKYYYKRLIDRSKFVYISYVDDEQNLPSRFIDELGIKQMHRSLKISNYHDILFTPSSKKRYQDDKEIVLDYDFRSIELSSSRFSDFLICPRRYYYKYIKKIEEAKVPSEDSDEKLIGIYLHEALKEFYTKQDHITESDELLLGVQRYLYKKIDNDIVLGFYIDLWLERLKEFSKKEKEHFEDGYRVAKCEVDLACEYRGFRFRGKIDRIDKKDDKLYVIDYKSGKVPSSKKDLDKERNFQLQFYEILASTIGEVGGSFYYDLKNAKLIKEDNFEQKFKVFDKNLDQLNEKKIDFYKCEDLNDCKFCPYKILCNRDIS